MKATVPAYPLEYKVVAELLLTSIAEKGALPSAVESPKIEKRTGSTCMIWRTFDGRGTNLITSSGISAAQGVHFPSLEYPILLSLIVTLF
jgi:hypothetical protein